MLFKADKSVQRDALAIAAALQRREDHFLTGETTCPQDLLAIVSVLDHLDLHEAKDLIVYLALFGVVLFEKIPLSITEGKSLTDLLIEQGVN